MPQMVIVADENIPCVPELFGRFGDIRRISGRDIQRADLSHAHVLLVRSVTTVNQDLLEGSRIQFIGSATIGIDHVDVEYLRSAGIRFAYAPGSNADSVAEYVTAAILRLCVRRAERLRGKKVGLVGAGEIGGRLALRLRHMGLEVLLNDPPRETALTEAGRKGDFRSLGEVLKEADIVSLHVPLVYDGPHPTIHLLDQSRLEQMKPGSWLLNTSRGAVVDSRALLRSLQERRGPAAVVLDVWENEPVPNADLVQKVDLATPHIAGYALDAKVRGTYVLYDALRHHLGPEDDSVTSHPGHRADRRSIPSLQNASPCMNGLESRALLIGAPDPLLPEIEWMDMFARHMYDIEEDDRAMRSIIGRKGIDAASFSSLRSNYRVRREFSMHSVPSSMLRRESRLVVEQTFRVGLR